MFIATEKIVPWASLALWGVIGLSCGHLLATSLGWMLAPHGRASAPRAATAPPASPWPRPQPQLVLQRNLFQAKVGVDNRLGDTAPAADLSGVELLGTVAGSDPRALILLDKEATVVHLDERIPNRGVVTAIERNRMTVRLNGGRIATLEVAESSSGAAAPSTPGAPSARRSPEGSAEYTITQTGPNQWLIPRSEAEKARGNLGQLLQQARMVPRLVNGATEGFVVAAIQPRSLLASLGIQRGDILLSVNDIPLDSPEKAMQIFTQLQEATRVTIGLSRNQQPMTFEYEVR